MVGTLQLQAHPAPAQKPCPPRAPVVQGPGENAGVIDAGDGMGVAFKIESHNHPLGGGALPRAATRRRRYRPGRVRMGARPVALLNSLRFGARAGQPQPGTAAGRRPRHGPTTAIAGCAHGGGEVYFDNCYGLNPLVNAMCIGVAPGAPDEAGVASGPGNRGWWRGPDGPRRHCRRRLCLGRADREDGDSPVVQGRPLAEKQLLEACTGRQSRRGGHPGPMPPD